MNVIWDIGNVLLSYRPEKFLEEHQITGEAAQDVMRWVFASKWWPQLDGGLLTRQEAKAQALAQNPPHAREIAWAYDNWERMLKPVAGSAQLLADLDARGIDCYYLSNYEGESFARTREKHEFFGYFKGGVVSFEVHANKPDAAIYQALFDRYNLRPEDCIFMDDMPENVAGAQRAGMQAFVFTDAQDAARRLEAL